MNGLQYLPDIALLYRMARVGRSAATSTLFDIRSDCDSMLKLLALGSAIVDCRQRCLARSRLVVLWALLCLHCVPGKAQQEPDVAGASDEWKISLEQMQLPDNLQAELFAAEPLVANIVAFEVDHRGRVFVAESFRQNQGVTDNREHGKDWLLADLAARTVQDRVEYHKRLLPDQGQAYTRHIDRIRRLCDTNGDGKADQVTTLVSGFNRLEEGTLAGLLVRGQEVYATCIPKLWKFVDQNDDGVSDQAIVLSDGYGVRVAFRGHDLHGLLRGPDGRLYFTIGDRGYHVTSPEGKLLSDPASGAVFRCEMDGSQLEVVATGFRNPQEIAFNDLGDLFVADNNSDSGDRVRLLNVLPGMDAGWRMHYQYLPDRGPYNRDRIWEPFHEQQPAYVVPPIANLGDGPAGLCFYPGTGFGDQLKDTFLVADFRGGAANSGIRAMRFAPEGAYYRLEEESQLIWRVLATDVTFGPDGAIWISDWVDGWNGVGKGRIYRVFDPDQQNGPLVGEVRSILASDWSATETSRLVSYLNHRDRRVRLEAQWELARRGEMELFTAIAADSEKDGKPRLHAIWGLDQCSRQNNQYRQRCIDPIATLLADSNAEIRAASAQWIGQHATAEKLSTGTRKQLRRMLADPVARCRYFAATALGQLQASDAFDDIVGLLQENDNADPALRHAGMMALLGVARAEQVLQLRQHPSEAVRRVAVVVLRRWRHAGVAEFLDDASNLVIGEAARAIHDAAISAADEALAMLIEQPMTDVETLRRTLNANYRIGSAESAQRLAQFAARASNATAMQVEALEMLSTWNDPEPLDRIINEYRPLQKDSRSAIDAATALAVSMPRLLQAKEEVKSKAVAVAAKLGLKDVVPTLQQRVATRTLNPQTRAAALQSLAGIDPDSALLVARQSLQSQQVSLRVAALEVLVRHSSADAAPAVYQAVRSRATEERQNGWDLLGFLPAEKNRELLDWGAEQFLANQLPADSELNFLEAAEERLSPSLQRQVQNKLMQRSQSSPLGDWVATLEGGNVESGARLFHERTEISCVRCHRVNGKGGEVGPDLTSIAEKRDRRYLLESIVLPDAAIAQGYGTVVLADDLGASYAGIILRQTAEEIDLILADGKKVTLEVDSIVARKTGPSAMPADLSKHLTPREMRDLVAYLASLKSR